MIRAWHRSSERAVALRYNRRRSELATAVVVSIADPKIFRSGRDFSAWIGLVPKQRRPTKVAAIALANQIARMAWAIMAKGGEPRVCSMVPVSDEADEDARRCVRERTEIISERVGLTNRIGAVLATLGVSD